MARHQDKNQRSNSDSKSETGGKDQAKPSPEPNFSVNVKKTRREAVQGSSEKPRAYPFELGLSRISSSEIQPISISAGVRTAWEVKPVFLDDALVELEEISTHSDLISPCLKIWESAKLRPTSPLYELIESTEIRLPPRLLFTVEPLEEDLGEEASRQDGEIDVDKRAEAAEEKEVTEVEDAETTGGAEAASEGRGIQSVPGIYEFLFEATNGSMADREPICIVAAKRDDDKYHQTLESLCREQFRQHIGGKPQADLLTSSEVQTVEETKVQNRIIRLDDSDNEFFQIEERIDQDVSWEILEEDAKGDLEKLRARIDEFFSEGLGYMLLFVRQRFAEELHNHLVESEDIRESNKITLLRLRHLPTDVKLQLVRLAWGNVFFETSSRDLDSMFHVAEDQFKEKLKPRGELEEITSQDPANPESLLHYWVKCFVVDCLASREGKKPLSNHSRLDLEELIPTEVEPWGESGPRPDVYHPKSGEAFEIETLFESDHKKITRTIDKYEGTNVKQVNVVLPNLTCLRNLDAVRRKTQEQPGEMFRNDVEFWTLDLENSQLLAVDELCDELNDLWEQSEHVM